MNIKLQRVSKHFELPEGGGRRNVLDEIDLTVEQGSSLSIVGPSGSGKSTLLNMIGGLDEPSGGKVLFDGRDLKDFTDREMAAFRNRHIGFVFQLHHLLPQLSLIENVLVPLIPMKSRSVLRAGQDRAMDLLEKVGLRDMIHQRPGQLSVGECQRAAVVRAMINEPQFILADEPTGSLDHRNADGLGDLLARLCHDKGVGVVVVTHALELAGKMRSVMKLEDGKLSKLIPEK